jgi:hypothetical protein
MLQRDFDHWEGDKNLLPTYTHVTIYVNLTQSDFIDEENTQRFELSVWITKFCGIFPFDIPHNETI